MKRPLICGFTKARNEIIRGNLDRCLKQAKELCDEIVACDDASVDGTRVVLQQNIKHEHLLLVPKEKQDFRSELFWKQKMMEVVHEIKPEWVLWFDIDEYLDVESEVFRQFCQDALKTENIAYRFHYTQLWRSKNWARTDSGFDEGSFIKLWRYQPDLSFQVREGVHFFQFPKQIADRLDGKGQSQYVPEAPWECIHWGNYGKCLTWKCIQYHGGLGDPERHINFEAGSFRAVGTSDAPLPKPYTAKEKDMIRGFGNMKGLEKTFTVIIPSYNRAWALPEALTSLLNQTYQKWIAIVLDDGSTDDTEKLMEEWVEKDPRIFYCRYEKQGAVRLNEYGMDMACEFTEYWTRLGSDDYFEPHKLELDAKALETADACYGPYRVLRNGELAETCNPKMEPGHIKNVLTSGAFVVSWANIAVKTSVLKKVKDKYGTYCDYRLLNCEDFLVNSRIVRFAEFTYRGEDGKHDAIWRISSDGASSNTQQTGSEEVITRKIIEEDNG